MRYSLSCILTVLVTLLSGHVRAGDGNRLTYLDESDPFYVSRTFPKLITPQWVGEEGVDAVVILAIDDMRDPAKYEAFLRPIVRRLQQIDGRAPVSIMSNQLDPRHPVLQQMLKAGLSIEVHTMDHPCPLLGTGDFAKAKSNYDRCVDLMNQIPGNKPVAFRMPCCDSLNTLSPRFFAEIFNKSTPSGNYLTIDSSVFNVLTSNDPDLPRDLVIDADSQDKFLKYLPRDRTFVTTIENYPYPYVIGKLCWEFPCIVPSDWEANHATKPNNPDTVRDLKAALDAVVIKQGVFDLVFHPHGWIQAEQVADLVDYAATKYGKRVKFLTFREAQERLTNNLLAGQTLRDAHGRDNGIRLVDLNNDGYLDVVMGNAVSGQTRLWSPQSRQWTVGFFPAALVSDQPPGGDSGARFGILGSDGLPSLISNNGVHAQAWHFDGEQWVQANELLNGLEIDGSPVLTATPTGTDLGVRFRDLDRDGRCELIVSNPHQQAIFSWSPENRSWSKSPLQLPAGAVLVNQAGTDNGVRFIDVDEDGREDVIFSNEQDSGLYLFTSMQQGWSRRVTGGKGVLPLIAHNGTNDGAWFHSRHLWVQNENTALLKDLVDRRSFNELLEKVDPQAKTPEASLHSIKVRPGFEVELVVSEPLVQSPIAFAWGPDGKMWVVEMGDYPLGVDGKGKPGGRIKFLEDTRGTGKYDKATVFLDNLAFPTGVMPWGKGVLVTCAPAIFYAEDTDGDGRADVIRPLYVGFNEGNQQHRVNSLVWGLDNWIYCANGDSGGRVRSAKTGQVVDMRGRDIRIRPDEGLIDAQAGQTQYGRSRDDWGNWFGNNNSNPMWHYALADHYIRRNPHVAAPDGRVHISVTPGAARVYPISRTLPRFNDPGAANHFTSACSAIVYRDELFGPAFANNTFVSEPVHNLIHREIMSPSGFTFASHRAPDEQQSEFLASSDNWFRPTMIQTGPDGALWVADMYRQVIEHPQWIPKDWQKRLDLRAGWDKGRIYRVYPIGKRPRAIPRLDQLDTAGLIVALDSPNGWQRDMAQQLLIQRKATVAIPLLENVVALNKRPLCRLHALCTLDGLNGLSEKTLLTALRDPDPGVRRHAVRLWPTAVKRLDQGGVLAGLVEDPDPQVRMQLAYSIGDLVDPLCGFVLLDLLRRDPDDRFLPAAVMSSVNAENFDALFVSAFTGTTSVPRPAITENLLYLAKALGHHKTLAMMLEGVAHPAKGRYEAWQYAALAGLLDGLDQQRSTLPKLANSRDEVLNLALRSAIAKIANVFAAARSVVVDQRTSKSERLQAIRLLGRGPDHRPEDLEILAKFLVPQVEEDLQAAAVATLGHVNDPAAAGVVLRGWRAYGPGLRTGILDMLFRRDATIQSTLDAIEHKQILPFEIDAVHRQRLLQSRSPGVRERAGRLLAGAVNLDRQKVIDAYSSVLSMPGDGRRGQLVFAKTCAACHQLRGIGHAVGPDLASLGDKSPESLMIAVLDPNRAVEARYVNYMAQTRNGLTYTGVLANETGNSITLLGPEGKQQVILRTDLEELVSSNKSVMPEGLEKDLKPQDLADLIAYIRADLPAARRP